MIGKSEGLEGRAWEIAFRGMVTLLTVVISTGLPVIIKQLDKLNERTRSLEIGQAQIREQLRSNEEMHAQVDRLRDSESKSAVARKELEGRILLLEAQLKRNQ